MRSETRLTVAGPMIVTPFSSATLMIFLVWASGIPSAMMAMVWIWKQMNRKAQLYSSAVTYLADGAGWWCIIPVGTAWSPWCYQRLNAKRQSWWARPHLGASSWRHSCSYRQGWGSLYGPNSTSVCGLHWKAAMQKRHLSNSERTPFT